VEYGGSQISRVGERQAAPSGADQFEDLSVNPDDHGATGE
jgi:hypothetical protein